MSTLEEPPTQPPASPRTLKFKYIFYGELAINAITCALCLVVPRQFFLMMFSPHVAESPVWFNFIRWYGILLFVISYIMGKFLVTQQLRPLLVVLEGYLIGDVAQIGASIWLAVAVGALNFGVIFAVGVTALLIAARILVLRQPEWLGF